VDKFSLENVGKSAGIFNPDKLLWLNSHYIKEESDEHLAQLLTPFLEKREVKVDDVQYLAKVVRGFKERSKTLEEMADAVLFYFKDKIDYQPKAAKKFLTPEAVDIFTEALHHFEKAEDFGAVEIEAIFNRITSERSIHLGQLAQPHRVALTGGTASPGIYEVIAHLGKERVIKRLKDAIAFVQSSPSLSDTSKSKRGRP